MPALILLTAALLEFLPSFVVRKCKMVWGLLLSVATIGASLISTKNNSDAGAGRLTPSSSHQLVLLDNPRLFLSGAGMFFWVLPSSLVVVRSHLLRPLFLTNHPQNSSQSVFGLGCSLLYNNLTTRFRVSERFRLFWLYWWNLDESRDLTPYRSPSPALDASEFIQQSADGSVRLLLSPNTAATSTLHVSLVSIVPGREMPSRKARGVEFYYVVAGRGVFSQQGVVETKAVQPGDCFVVDSGNMRWISNNKASKEDLVLLRATDGGLQYSSRSHADRIRRDPNHRASSMERLTVGFRAVQAKARDYYKTSNGQTNGGTSSS